MDGQTVTGEDEAVIPPCHSESGALYLPLREVLLAHGATILPSDSVDNPGYAFAMGGSLYRLSYGLNQAGTPINLEIILNGVRQLLRDPRRSAGDDRRRKRSGRHSDGDLPGIRGFSPPFL